MRAMGENQGKKIGKDGRGIERMGNRVSRVGPVVE